MRPKSVSGCHKVFDVVKKFHVYSTLEMDIMLHATFVHIIQAKWEPE